MGDKPMTRLKLKMYARFLFPVIAAACFITMAKTNSAYIVIPLAAIATPLIFVSAVVWFVTIWDWVEELPEQ